MRNGVIEEEVIVHPVDGMQLCEGFICREDVHQFIGILSGMTVSVGESIDETLQRMTRFAKAYYGDDVVVEIISHAVKA